MWIRSQNGNILAYCQTLGFSEDGCEIIEVRDNVVLILGNYKTPEQAKMCNGYDFTICRTSG